VPTDHREHPLFARYFDRLSRAIEGDLGPYRRDLLAGLTGRVLEVGAGNGINFAHYPPQVEEVIAIEPEPYLRAKAEAAAADAPVAVSVRDGVGARIDLPDDSVEAAVACLVLCSIPDQAAALSELRRVVRPGGELRFFEHVRADSAGKARVQSWLDRSGVWPRLFGGCHCSRDTVAAIAGAGFAIEDVRMITLKPGCSPSNPHAFGVARA
jgi:SAM-dependent methyltransferase